MFRSGLVDTLVTHIKGFGLTPLSGDPRGYMPPLLKTKQIHKIEAVQEFKTVELKYSDLFLFQFVTRSVGRISTMDVIVYSSNYCAHGSYEYHSIEDHFEKRQGYEKGIILKLFY